MKNLKKFQEELREQIGNNKVVEVLNHLIKELIANSTSYSIAIQQKRRFKGLTEELSKGTISFDEMQLSINKLSAVVLDLINNLDERDFKSYEREKFQEAKSEKADTEETNGFDGITSKFYYIETVKDIVESNYAVKYFLQGKKKMFLVKNLQVEYFKNELRFHILYERRKETYSEGFWHPKAFDREILDVVRISLAEIDTIGYSEETIQSGDNSNGVEDLFIINITLKNQKPIHCERGTYKEDSDLEMWFSTERITLDSFHLPMMNKSSIRPELERSLNKILVL